MRIWLPWVLVVLITVPAWGGQADGTADRRRITELTGDIYRFHDGESGEMTIFAVTTGGIVLVDPLNEAAATWLKAELARRFPGRSVNWVVLTHHHYDRAAGSAIFDGATTIGQRRYNDVLAQARQQLPPDVAGLDANGNNRLESAEIAGHPREQWLRRYSRSSGVLYPDDLYREVDGVAASYNTTFSIPLGGQTVRLVHIGPAHAPDMTAVHFPAERLVFVADAVRPETFSPAMVRPRDAIRWIDALLGLDADTYLSDTNERISRQDLQSFRAYLADLLAGVAAGHAAGRTIAEVQSRLPLDAHQTSPAYAGRATHIAEAYRQLMSRSFEAYAAPAYVSTVARHSYCSADYDACGWGTAARAFTGGVSLSFNWLAITAEFTGAQQTIASRTSAFYDDAFAHRESGWSALAGYRSRRHGRLSYVALAGLGRTMVDVRGVYRVKEKFAPQAGRAPIYAQGSRTALVAGGDAILTLNRRLAVVAPVRIGWATSSQLPNSRGYAATSTNFNAGPQGVRSEPFWPGRMSFQAGVGVRVPLLLRAD